MTDEDTEEKAPLFERISGVLADAKEEDTSSFPQSNIGMAFDRWAYGLFGGWFRGKDDKYAGFHRKLRQSRIPVSYDVYLSRIVLLSILFALIGTVIGLVVGTVTVSILATFSLGVNLPPSLASLVNQNQTALIIGGVTLTSGFIFFITVFGYMYYKPYYIASERGRKIDALLPHAVTFMYAMSRGGINILGVIRSIANADDMYMEVSEEFQAILSNVEYVQEDLQTAVTEEAFITPSDNLKNFLEDLLSVVDTGSDMETFFYNRAEVYLERERKEQAQLLETLEILSEAFVTMFVAAPIFLLVVLVVMSMMGSGSFILQLYGMTYAGLPLGGFLFITIIKLISGGNTTAATEIDYSNKGLDALIETKYDEDSLSDDNRYKSYRKMKRKKNWKDKIVGIKHIIRQNPHYSFLFTVPAAIGFVIWAHTSGIAPINYQSFLQAPAFNSFMIIYLPMVITLGVYTIISELKQRRENHILQRLPEVFKSASDANERGLSIEESLRVVSDKTSGQLAQELERAVNQANWTGDLNGALVDFANNVRVPRLSRTIKLITKANEVSGDLQSVLDVAAKDVENMYELDVARKQNALTYLMVIMVSFLVSLGVIVMLDNSFLSTVATNEAFSGASESEVAAGGGGPSIGGGVPVEEFRLAFVHLTMILGITSGLVAGVMGDNTLKNGLKFSLVMSGIAVLVFMLA